VKLGRKPGSTTAPVELLERHRDIVKQLKAGHSVRHTAAITGKGTSTVMRIKAMMEATA
jgi:uncharacterized protein YerC